MPTRACLMLAMLVLAAMADAATAATSVGPRVWFSVGAYQVRDDDLWIAGTAVLCSVACGVVGCFLVLRRMSLLGDAISHAILPGLALAFIFTHSREPWAMLGGALVVGVATAYLSTALSRWGRVPEDAAMGVVFTTLFAVGVVLITWVARDVDLDPGCVLYGLIEFTPFDTTSIAGLQVPRAFVWLAVVLAVNVGLITVFFKELRIVCFDPYLATTMGISATLVHYGLMTAVAATSVASFESVGSILVVAMLVAPGATAHLLTDRLSRMVWIAAGIAAVTAVAGYALAVWVNTSVAGMIASVALGLFMLTTLFSPRYGFVSRQVRQLGLALRIAEEDCLGMLYRWHERSGGVAEAGGRGGAAGDAPVPRPLTASDVVAGTHSGLLGRIALWWLARRGLVRTRPAASVRAGVGGPSLVATEAGLRQASRIVRGHRLWESFLAKHLSLPLDHVHAGAHRAEHFLSPEIQERLAGSEPAPADPHGRPIPPRP
ncbi:MAG: metal ABC transporter permease [Phycisphaerales bacterium]